MPVLEILKVIYSPFKAFKEIAQNPRYVGPLIIIGLLAAAYVGSAYVVVNKTYNEQVLPALSDGDQWTDNRTLWNPLWTSDGVIGESGDALSGNYFGNKSVEFSAVNTTSLWMRLNPIGPVDCTGAQGYTQLYFRMKLIYPDAVGPRNASIQMSSGESDHFSYNLTERIASTANNVWDNFTVPIGPQAQWVQSGANTSWGNITTIRFAFTWPSNANFTVRMDGLFFRGLFESLAQEAVFYTSSLALLGIMQYVVSWVLLSGLLYIVLKSFGGQPVWRILLILVGYAFVTLVVQGIINAVLYASLPTVNYRMEYFAGLAGDRQVAFNQVYSEIGFVFELTRYAQVIIHVWTVVLTAIIVHSVSGFGWPKSGLVASAAYLGSLLAVSFLLGV